ncbi:MAG: methyl-accepting chemotaxis protein, partial [Spirochaetota bacterium]|nr:methyl-accepting chemotaxis protein [Spirochaetota bacterium]
MRQRKFYQGIKGKLIVLFLLIGIVPMVIGAVISVWLSSESLETEVNSKLDAIHEIKTSQIKGYFAERKGDIVVLANNYMTRQAMTEFSMTFANLGKNKLRELYITNNPNPEGKKHIYNYAPDASDYSAHHGKYHPLFRQYLEEYGYYDIFLVDNTGNIVYSVYKEQDYATN